MRLLLIIFLFFLFQGCSHNSEEHKQFGFQSIEEIHPYLAHRLTTEFLANYLTGKEWNTFYDAFPEFLVEQALENALSNGAPVRNPKHTAYAWRMFTMERKKNWDPETIRRLDAHEVAEGDDIYQILYAKGVPRFAANNDYRNLMIVLAYKPDLAYLLRKGKLESTHSCPGCWEYQSGLGILGSLEGMSDYEVFDNLGLNENKQQGLAGTRFYK